jgi:DNA-binding transcriptional ArsR family regulator
MQRKTRNPANPTAGLKASPRPRPARHASPRRLSDKQLKNPLIRAALPRLAELPAHRGRYLRRLDNVHASGRRTRAEVFGTLAAIAEPLLCRLDLATGALGWLDESGEFRLATQSTIADDAGVSPAQLSRLLGLLVEAGYAHTRTEKIQVREAGLELVRTRVLCRFTDLFFRDLGLALHYERAQRAARKRRERQLSELAASNAERLGRRALERVQRDQRRSRWEASQERRSNPRPPAGGMQGEAFARALHDLRLALKLANPELSAAEVNAQAEALALERAQRN